MFFGIQPEIMAAFRMRFGSRNNGCRLARSRSVIPIRTRIGAAARGSDRKSLDELAHRVQW